MATRGSIPYAALLNYQPLYSFIKEALDNVSSVESGHRQTVTSWSYYLLPRRTRYYTETTPPSATKHLGRITYHRPAISLS